MDFLLAGGAIGALAAILFLEGGMFAIQCASSLESSPWTAESFGADERRARSAREYLVHAVAVSTVFGTIAALAARSWWPIVGVFLMNGYLVWVYLRAIGRAKAAGSSNWASEGSGNGPSVVVPFAR